MTASAISTERRLLLIKLLHTLIWLFFSACVLFVLLAGITGISGTAVWVAVVLVLVETGILLLNRWSCPLTHLARKYSQDPRDNFDIYLPEWMAHHNKTVCGLLYTLGLLLLALRSAI